jgi:regulatory protein
MQRALAALARREHSRLELARKLQRFAEQGEIDAVLDRLEQQKLLSAERFSQSLLNRRAERYGSARIVRELQEHDLDPELIRERAAELARSEVERCHAVWQKKFDTLPDSLEERARQTRFLAARGFSGEAIRAVLKGVVA